MGLELLLQSRGRGVSAASGPLAACLPSHPPQTHTQTYSDDGVQLRSCDLLSPLNGSQDLLLVLEGEGTRGLWQSPGQAPLPYGLLARPPNPHGFPPHQKTSFLSSCFLSPSFNCFIWKMGTNRDVWKTQRSWGQILRKRPLGESERNPGS